MTSKEKANELLNKFNVSTRFFNQEFGWVDNLDASKDCALILVEEILSTIYKDYYDINNGVYEFWEDVKKEIENM